MTNPFIQIGEERREMTEIEFSEWQKLKQETAAEEIARVAALEAVAVAKASARAKLAALGLTDAEVAALLGA